MKTLFTNDNISHFAVDNVGYDQIWSKYNSGGDFVRLVHVVCRIQVVFRHRHGSYGF